MMWPTLGSTTAEEQNTTEATVSFTSCFNKKGDTKLIAVTLLSNLHRFLKFLNRQIFHEIFNKAITKNLSTPCIFCHTTRRRATGCESQRLCDKRGNDRPTQGLLFTHNLRHQLNSIQLNFTKSDRGRNGHLHRSKMHVISVKYTIMTLDMNSEDNATLQRCRRTVSVSVQRPNN